MDHPPEHGHAMLYQKWYMQQNKPFMNEPSQPKSSHSTPNQLKAYADLVRLYPDNRVYLGQYADLLIANG